MSTVDHAPDDGEQFGARVTVDVDAKHHSRAEFRMRAVRTWHNLKREAEHVEVHVSSSGQGLHFVAWYDQRLQFHEEIAIRRGAGDDPRRVWMDCQRWLQGLYTGVLFEEKDQRPQSKERGFRDVYDALDYIDAQRPDYDRMRRLANDGHRGAPDLARRRREL